MIAILLFLAFTIVAGLPADHILIRPDHELRYQHVEGGDGLYLADLWTKLSDIQDAARYNPDSQNVYHLFTRDNPSVSQPLLLGNAGLLAITNYEPHRRTIVLLHGYQDNAVGSLNAVLVPAFLAAEDVNVIVVDWSLGSNSVNLATSVANTVTSGESVARFINWLNQAAGVTAGSYHIVGYGLGGHQAGIVGRNVDGDVAYITGLDPSFYLWIINSHKFRPDDGSYTEIIHTNAGINGYLGTLGHVDFYPNGGVNMPGCNGATCDQERSFFYFAESLVSGGFTGRRCATYAGAMSNLCYMWGNLRMGGIAPKTGSRGIYRLETNSRSPFSRG
ncbi:pancreatic triacylglycerol lipase-like [Hyposmocoma kahamanoa]|uniref:pancreatic triacylglycerol lipase-like n=1 Tax=Hyposmocoma kahamanoa TaxID=1477025 RepID=UPI000E6D6935|nr:pancreatic triacylglycerol lipase-like [Hyposmocoma kahamanoa]